MATNKAVLEEVWTAIVGDSRRGAKSRLSRRTGQNHDKPAIRSSCTIMPYTIDYALFRSVGL